MMTNGVRRHMRFNIRMERKRNFISEPKSDQPVHQQSWVAARLNNSCYVERLHGARERDKAKKSHFSPPAENRVPKLCAVVASRTVLEKKIMRRRRGESKNKQKNTESILCCRRTWYRKVLHCIQQAHLFSSLGRQKQGGNLPGRCAE